MDNQPAPYRHDPLAAVKIPEFRNLMIGRFSFIIALRMMGTLVGWWLYELTNDPFAIGLVGLAEVIPALSLALYAGHKIDVSEKRKLMLTGVIAYLLCAIILFFISTQYFYQHTGKSIVAISIYTVIFITGIIRSFTGPSFPAIIGQMVPKDILPIAITWNQGVWLTASVLGHAIAGFSIAFIKNSGTLLLISSFIVIALYMLSLMQPKPASQSAKELRTWDSVKEGLKFVLNTKIILGALTLDLFAVLFGGAVAMVPVFAKDILNVGPIGFGWLNAAADIGSIIIIIWMTFFPIRKNQGKAMLLAVAGFGICIILFGLSKLFWLSFAALVLSGLLDGVSMVVRSTILQLYTPDKMRGRVMSVNSMFINSSNELGQFESGLAAKILGVVPSVVFGGGMTLLVVITTWFKAPSLRKMEY